MELKAGYKQTEVGAIPVDWNAKTLGDVMVHCFSGATPSRSRPDFYKGNIRWITSGELNYNVIEDTAEKISKEAVIKTNLKILPKNTFLMAITGLEAEGTRGSCGIVGEESTTNQSCMAILPTDELLTEYLFQYYVFKGKSLALRYCQGTKQQSYTAKIVKILPIPLPPIDEQRTIAAALSDVDALIAALDRLVAKKRDIKRAAMQELLSGRRRLPGFSGEWMVVAFEQVATPRSEKVNPRKVGELPFCIELEHIEQGSGRLIGSSSASERSSIKSVFHQSDVLFGKLRAYLRKYWLADRDGHCSTEIWPLIPNRHFTTPGYLFQLVMTERFLEAATIAYGTHMPRTDWNVVKGYQVKLPDINEQEAVASVLSDMDAEIAALESRLEKTLALKQGMMQELLTGRIRLVKGAQT